MKTEAFRAWLVENFSPNTVNTQFSCAKRVEEAYGDLDEQFEVDRLEGFAAKVAYSSADARAGRPNPTPFPITGNLYSSLSSFKSAIRCYARFREQVVETVQETAIELAAETIRERRAGKIFELEAHLQSALRDEISQLEEGLTIADGGAERSVTSGSIDILARDESGALVVVELKRDLARRETIGQIAGYMGDLMDEEPDQAVRGIIVAGDFDRSCLGAARAIPSIQLVRYRFKFAFEDAVRERAPHLQLVATGD